MTTIHVACECGKAYDVPAQKAGMRFKCPACGQAVHVPAAAPAPEPEPERTPEPEPQEAAVPPARAGAARGERAGGSPRAGGRGAASRRREEAPPKSKAPLLVGGGLVVVLAAVGGYFALRGGGSSGAAGGGEAKGSAGAVAAVEPKKAEPKPEPPKDPLARKREELAKKVAEAAKAPSPAEAYLAAAAFCLAEPKLEAEAQGLYEKVLAKDSDNAAAREALGYKRYTGDDPQHSGQWVSAAMHAELTEADARRKAEEEKRRNDPFVKEATRIMKEMESAIAATNAKAKQLAAEAPENPKESDKLDIDKPKKSDAEEAKFKFFFDCKEVPRPYLLAVQDVGVPKPESWALSIGEILGALHRTFYRRYASANLRDLSGTPVPVWVFASKGQYERWRRAGNGGPPTTFVRAFYTGTAKDNASGYLYLWLRDPREETNFTDDPIEEIRETAWHEGTHQLMDFNSPGRGFSIGNSPWMQEGFAEYVGGHRRFPDKGEPDGWRYFLGVPMPERRTAISNKGLAEKDDEETLAPMKPSLKEIVHCSYPEFWMARSLMESKGGTGEERQKAGELVDGIYCIGWGLCHFLQHHENGKYREGFNQWLRAELEKRSSPDLFEQIFGLDSDAKWREFELAFQNYVVFPLRRDAKKVVSKDEKIFKKYQDDFEAACAKK